MTDVAASPDDSLTAAPRIPESVRARSQARSGRAGTSPGGPAPGRILAAAASVCVGIGLVAVLAGTSQSDVVIEVNPTPVIVQTMSTATSSGVELSTAGPAPEVVVIAGATPADAGVAGSAPVARSEGS